MFRQTKLEQTAYFKKKTILIRKIKNSNTVSEYVFFFVFCQNIMHNKQKRSEIAMTFVGINRAEFTLNYLSIMPKKHANFQKNNIVKNIFIFLNISMLF